MLRARALVNAVCVTVGCSTASVPPDTADIPDVDVVSLVTQTGPFGVGYSVSSVEYPDPAGSGMRSLRLAIWYPSSAETREQEIRYQGVFLREGAVEDAPWASGSFPLAVFSHGHQAFAEASSFLMVHLASHGWVVVAPDHTGNTTFDPAERDTSIYYTRPLDLSAVIDHSLTLPQVGDEGIVALGHSFGGYTVFAAAGGRYDEGVISDCLDETDSSEFCSTMTDEDAVRFRDTFAEPRVDGWIALAPGDYRLFGPDGLTNLNAPALLMSGSVDPRTGADAAPYWGAMDRGHNRHVAIEGGGHQTFTDFSGTLESPAGLIEPSEGFSIVRGYVLAFARRHGQGDREMDAILDGSVSWSEAATLSD